ncbi:hypothetical protein CONPUDRAFT_114287 [Coniophora puteana RWD-64-598 SS2]|uniref:Glycosyltransferase family 25 protein n=1 Tax=Coniophora puteana (strain RWD-64-598) TaxID=741705 RepID=A0A5M3N5L6_CONPW|nr:uncharacterized protein CONPUDRAFT_114287 [Coniophora puteana RWD-64-598 SS2]EIW86155.1 hypothetical protein CONPUDRAFT_114287 [Coniophora puteana RWD-64-598 SS2]
MREEAVHSNNDRYATLGVATHIYVISLPRRDDRRIQMEWIRRTQNITWRVLDAIDSDDPVVVSIMDGVARERSRYPAPEFHWPSDINALSLSSVPISASVAEPWDALTSDTSLTPQAFFNASATYGNLTCASGDTSIPDYSSTLPDYKLLTPAKVACWYSHVHAIRTFVERNALTTNGVAVYLEDDIDLDKNIRHHLKDLWPSLPAGWDIVFLGHCWSNESHHAALSTSRFFSDGDDSEPAADGAVHRLHPSRAPKCSHGYVLSLAGARRLLLHLSYPPFAYSRAFDQAVAWLVESGRLRSYSVVPSLVVQRKVASSDVSYGVGSSWREVLPDGVLSSGQYSR